MPDNSLSTSGYYAAFLVPDKVDPLIDFEWGGVDLLDSSQGLMVKVWKCFYEDNWIKITDDTIIHDLINIANVKSLSLAFDFNMHATVTYVVENDLLIRETFLYWYDTLIGQQVTTNYGAEYLYPQLSLDDHRLRQSANADIIFAYIKGGNLCYRQQRDRYNTERILYENLPEDAELKQIGMNTINRFQFVFW